MTRDTDIQNSTVAVKVISNVIGVGWPEEVGEL